MRPHLEGQVPLVKPGEVVQLIHEPCHPAGLAVRLPQSLAEGPRNFVPLFPQCLAERPEDQGQGRAKLVGEIGKEAAFRPLELGHLFVERFCPSPRPVPAMAHCVEEGRHAGQDHGDEPHPHEVSRGHQVGTGRAGAGKPHAAQAVEHGAKHPP